MEARPALSFRTSPASFSHSGHPATPGRGASGAAESTLSMSASSSCTWTCGVLPIFSAPRAYVPKPFYRPAHLDAHIAFRKLDDAADFRIGISGLEVQVQYTSLCFGQLREHVPEKSVVRVGFGAHEFRGVMRPQPRKPRVRAERIVTRVLCRCVKPPPDVVLTLRNVRAFPQADEHRLQDVLARLGVPGHPQDVVIQAFCMSCIERGESFIVHGIICAHIVD